jgi:hypothetical protein
LFKVIFLLASWRSIMKIAGSGSESGSGSISQRHGSANPDPHKNVMDPQQWLILWDQVLRKCNKRFFHSSLDLHCNMSAIEKCGPICCRNNGAVPNIINNNCNIEDLFLQPDMSQILGHIFDPIGLALSDCWQVRTKPLSSYPLFYVSFSGFAQFHFFSAFLAV